jgi:hypothetical protein
MKIVGLRLIIAASLVFMIDRNKLTSTRKPIGPLRGFQGRHDDMEAADDRNIDPKFELHRRLAVYETNMYRLTSQHQEPSLSPDGRAPLCQAKLTLGQESMPKHSLPPIVAYPT